MATKNALAERHRNLVIKALGYTEEGYDSILFETAMEYLEHYLSGNQKSIKTFSEHNQFWNWWKTQYALIDEAWLVKYGLITDDQDLLHQTYVEMHFKMDKHIDKVVWESIWEKQHTKVKEEVSND